MVGTWKLVRAVARDGSGATLPEPWCWRRIRRCGSSQRAGSRGGECGFDLGEHPWQRDGEREERAVKVGGGHLRFL